MTISDPQTLQTIIHNYGLTAMIVDLTLALAPAQAWQQYVVAFDTFEGALRFGESLAHDETLTQTPDYGGRVADSELFCTLAQRKMPVQRANRCSCCTSPLI